MHPYRSFIAMIIASSTLMFGLMYLNTYQISHVWFSQTRMFMTFIMAGSMALVMLFFMRHMYKNKQANSAIVVAGVVLIALGIWLVRSQQTVGDVAWMKAMIPHHSIAILTSERATITDPRARELADSIIRTQRREIDEMESLIDALGDSAGATAQDSHICRGGGELHQLRVYEINRGNKDAFHRRFRDHALRIMKRHGFKIVDMWESDTGGKLQFVYLLSWPDKATMDSRWEAFLADQEWIDIKRSTAQESGELVREAKGQPLVRVSYSPACA